SKLKTFDIVAVTREQLEHWTGKTEWTAEEKLSEKFFERLRAVTGCDAVMFCRLTRYRPYMPIAVGWNLKLVDGTRKQVVWAVDGALKQVPDVRPEAVARATSLLNDVQYPPLQTIRAIAHLLALRLSDENE